MTKADTANADRCPRCGAIRRFGLPPELCPVCVLRDTLALGGRTDEEKLRVEELPGRYEDLGEVGRGGMGQVHRVHDAVLNREVAFKELIRSDQSASGPAKEVAESARAARFLREAHVTAQLEHPSITPVYEFGYREDGTPYYTMKRIRGRTLAEALNESDTLEARLSLLPHFIDVCQALAYAHDKGVIHRDVKPSNIMIGGFGETVLLDWGLAKSVNASDESFLPVSLSPESPVATATGEVLGSPLYMAPEQADGSGEGVDHRADIYSLGVILYELLTGRTPVAWSTLSQVLKAVTTADAPEIIEQLPDAPPELVAICKRAMAKEPEGRYQSAGELAEDVLAYQRGAVVSAYTYSLGEQLKRIMRRDRKLVITILTGLVAILILSVWYMANVNWTNAELRAERAAAAEARDIAQAQRDLALEAIDKLTYDVPDRLRNVTGARPILRGILEDNIAMLDRIHALDPDTSDARVQQIANFERVGTRWLLLGDSDRAVDAYRSALQIAEELARERPDDIATKKRLARAYSGLGHAFHSQHTFSEAVDHYEKSRALAADVLEASPNDEELEKLLALIQFRLAGIFSAQYKFDQAVRAVRESLDLFESLLQRDPGNSTVQKEYGEALLTYGAMPLDVISPEDGLAHLAQAAQVFAEEIEKDPKNLHLKSRLAIVQKDVGFHHRRLGNFAESLRAYQEARHILRRLVELDPTNADYQRDLTTIMDLIGNLYHLWEKYPESIEALEAALQLSGRLQTIDPQNKDYRRINAFSTTELARVYRDAGDLEQALRIFEESQLKWEALAEDDPNDPLIRHELAQNCSNIGILHTRMKRPEEAVKHLIRSFKLYSENVKQVGYIPVSNHDSFNNTYTVLIIEYRKQRDTDEELDLRMQYIAALEQHMAARPEDASKAELLAHEYVDAARVHARLEDFAASKDCYERALEIFARLQEKNGPEVPYSRNIERIQRALRALTDA